MDSWTSHPESEAIPLKSCGSVGGVGGGVGSGVGSGVGRGVSFRVGRGVTFRVGRGVGLGVGARRIDFDVDVDVELDLGFTVLDCLVVAAKMLSFKASACTSTGAKALPPFELRSVETDWSPLAAKTEKHNHIGRVQQCSIIRTSTLTC